jgi:hypothetical protein
VRHQPSRDLVEDLSPVGVGEASALVDVGGVRDAGRRAEAHDLPELEQPRAWVAAEQHLQQRRARSWLAEHDDRALDALLVDRVPGAGVEEPEPVDEETVDHGRGPGAAVVVQPLVELRDERSEPSGERRVAEVVEPGGGAGVGDQLVGLEGHGRRHLTTASHR